MIPGHTAARGYRLPSEADIDEFAAVLGQFERGEIGPDVWRAFRLVRGTYGQRQTEDAQMLRVKIPQGILNGAQLEALADVADCIRAASPTSRRGRTCSSISCGCTTSSRRCAGWPKRA